MNTGIESLYFSTRALDDGRIIGVHRLMFHWTLHIDISDIGYEDRYCYHQLAAAIIDMHTWDGKGDPPGRWHKHPATGRRRNPDTGFIWHESEARDANGNLITRNF
jgi:hypothetical protein